MILAAMCLCVLFLLLLFFWDARQATEKLKLFVLCSAVNCVGLLRNILQTQTSLQVNREKEEESIDRWRSIVYVRENVYTSSICVCMAIVICVYNGRACGEKFS